MKNPDYLWVQSRISDFSREYLLPVSRSKGMHDFVVDGFGEKSTYRDCWTDILNTSKLMLGGYLKYTGEVPESYSLFGTGSMESPYFQSMMEAYDKYLCSDGRIRFNRTPDADFHWEVLFEEYSKALWDDINRSFEERGMFWNEELECWVNPETGEEGCF